MSLSVVVPTFNERTSLATCLDALTQHTTEVEVIVVNAPSTDGTSGMIHERTDVDVLLECTSRNINVARNAGIREATGDIIALLAPTCTIQPRWEATIEETLGGAADAVSGPIRPTSADDPSAASKTGPDLGIDGDNLALSREAITAIDGFDEVLSLDGTADVAQRLRGHGLHVVWNPDMEVHRIASSDGGEATHRGDDGAWRSIATADWGERYRSVTYRHVKNRGIRPGVLVTLLGAAVKDGVTAAVDVLRGDGTPSQWVGNGIDVVTNCAVGVREGWRARQADGTAARNPHGLSRGRTNDHIETRHDWRPA